MHDDPHTYSKNEHDLVPTAHTHKHTHNVSSNCKEKRSKRIELRIKGIYYQILINLFYKNREIFQNLYFRISNCDMLAAIKIIFSCERRNVLHHQAVNQVDNIIAATAKNN